MQPLVFRTVNIQITFVTMTTSYTNLSTLKLDTHSSLQTLIHFTRILLIFRLSFRLWVFDATWQFRLFFFEFADQPTSKTLGVKFRWPLRKHAIKIVFLWLVHFDPLVKKMSDANHLSGPLRKQKFTSTGSKGHGLWFVIGGFRSVLWVSVFQGSFLVIVMTINSSEKRNWRGGCWASEFACFWKA